MTMKTKDLNTLSIALAAIMIVMPIGEINAQPIEIINIVTESSQVEDCANISSKEMDKYTKNTITEEDYPFLKSLDCMKKNNYLKNRGWNLKLRNIDTKNASHYELRAKGPKIDLHATYDKDGQLVESIFRKRDTRLPYSIREFIISGEFEGWKMIRNEMTVTDFNIYQTEYKIVLTDGTMEKVLNSKNHGSWIALLEN